MKLTKFVTITMVVLALAAPAAGHEHLGWIAMIGTDTLVPIDLATADPLLPSLDLLPEGSHPYDVTVHPWLHEVWICGRDGDGIVVVNTDTASIIHRLDLGTGNHYPVDIVFDRTGNTAFIADRDAEQVILVDVATHSFTGQVVTGPSSFAPGWMAVHPLNGDIYMTDWQGGEIYVVDPISLTISTTSYPGGYRLRDLKFAPDGSMLYVANGVGNDQLLAIDPDSMAVVNSAVTGADPWAVDVTLDGAMVFTANQDGGDVTAVNTSTFTSQTIPLVSNADPRDLDIAPDGSAVYVTSGGIAGEDAVFVIDPTSVTIVDTILLGTDDSFANVLAVARQGLHAGWLFADGFEQGDTSEWSAATP